MYSNLEIAEDILSFANGWSLNPAKHQMDRLFDLVGPNLRAIKAARKFIGSNDHYTGSTFIGPFCEALTAHPVPLDIGGSDNVLPFTMEQIKAVPDMVIGEFYAQYALSPATSGSGRIAIERQRQITEEGFSDAHDDAHGGGQLAEAAAAYILRNSFVWPLNFGDSKFKTNLQNLVRAGALIAAEIDRLQRIEQADFVREVKGIRIPIENDKFVDKLNEGTIKIGEPVTEWDSETISKIQSPNFLSQSSDYDKRIETAEQAAELQQPIIAAEGERDKRALHAAKVAHREPSASYDGGVVSVQSPGARKTNFTLAEVNDILHKAVVIAWNELEDVKETAVN